MSVSHPPCARRLLAWLTAISLAAAGEAAALGKAEEMADDARLEVKDSKQWVYLVAAFDVSSLPPTERLVGDLSARRIARELSEVGVRRRSPDEVEAYADAADDEARRKAGDALAEKRNARAALLFSGHPGWKYRKELAKADAAVDAAEEHLLETVRARSSIEIEAAVRLSDMNSNGTLPKEPPGSGLATFCAENQLDALVTGSVEPFYGRFRLSLLLYSRYLRKTIYEDGTVFSGEDRDTALSELIGRLRAFVGGVAPAALAITADPPDADMVIDGKLVGTGSFGPAERRPEQATVEVSASGYEPAEFTVDLASDELASVSVRLKALAMEDLQVEATAPPGTDGAPGTAEAAASDEAAATDEGSRAVGAAGTAEATEAVEAPGTAEARDVAVRLGSLYAGVAPIDLRIPAGKMSFVSAETADGWGASAVVSGGGRLVLDLKPLPGPEAKPVETARRRFYRAFGRFSIALPISFFLSGMALVYENAAVWSGDGEKAAAAENARLWANVAVSLTVALFADSAIKCGAYLYEANSRVTPLARSTGSGAKKNEAKGR